LNQSQCTASNGNNNNNNNNNNSNNNNNNEDGAVVAAHSTDYDYSSDDYNSDDESIISTDGEGKADEATLQANVEEDGPTGPSPAPISNDEDFRATILANTVAEYDDDLQEVEDGFVNPINNQQDVNDAFNDNEPEALACAYVVVIDIIDNTVGDDFAVVNNNCTVQVLESSVEASVEEDTSNNISNNNDLIAPSFGKDVAVPISEADATLHATRNKITAVFAVAVAVTDIKFTDHPHTINNVIEYAML
jgi:hypothetical protein